MMELIDLKHLKQEQLINLINKASVFLDRENYPLTHLYVNALTAEPEYIDPDTAWTKKTPRLDVEPPIENWWGESRYVNNWMGETK